jgi:hypothetical protein
MCGFALCVLIYGFIVQENDPGFDRPFRCEVRNLFVVYETTANAFVLGLL